jgi:hypothetical protein
MRDREVVLTESQVKRLSRSIRHVEGARRGRTGPGPSARRKASGDIWVVFQEVMHFAKTSKTKAFLWLPDENSQSKPAGQNADDGIELEIFPGPIAKGIWLPGDVVICRSIDPQGLAPISHGRQFFEGTLSGTLAASGTANVTIFGTTIEVKEGGFAASSIPSGRKVGCTLAHGSSAGNPGYEWRATIARC